MKKLLLHLLVVMMLLPNSPAIAFDQFVGDTAIYGYSASAGLRPNVLLIIDNSNAAANTSSGLKYDPNTDYTPEGGSGYDRWDIYQLGQQGEPENNPTVNNSTETLENLTCTSNNNIIKTTLLTTGTYSGRGTVQYPSIKNGGCFNTKAYSYVLGNYLNYLNTPPPGDVVTGSNGYTYRLIASHTSSADNKPVSGANWANYWALSGSTDTAQAWQSGYAYTLPAPPNSQVKTVYDALETVIGGARFAVNFGAMVFNAAGNKGGRVIHQIGDLSNDADFQNFLSKLPGSGHANETPLLTSQTVRPQAEALLDAGYYFRGLALPISGQSAMPSPIINTCDKNFIILITNGLSNKDDDTNLTTIRVKDQDGNIIGAPNGDVDRDGQEPGDYGTGGSHYLDDVAKFIYETDARSTLEGVQRIQTHTILAFQAEDELVRRASDSTHGRGSFHNVFNANELSEALTKVFANIVLEADTSFVAPVVPTSPENKTYSGERVYVGLFRPITQRPWHGNLKKYGINGNNDIVDANGNIATLADGSFNARAKSYWSTEVDAGTVERGGVGDLLYYRLTDTNDPFSSDPAVSVRRHIYSNISSTVSSLADPANLFSAASVTAADLGYTVGDGQDNIRRDKLVNYIYGYDSYDDNENGATADKRDWILGDILHSKPAVVSYRSYAFTPANEVSCSENKTMIYVGANDGMLHAFRDCDGREMWSFIPKIVWSNLKELGRRPALHSYYVDSSPIVYKYDANKNGIIETGDKVILLFGLRRGGDAYYALDVTDPLAPKYLWDIHGSLTFSTATPGFEDLGQTWSEPQLGVIKVQDSGVEKKMLVAFVGAGYDKQEDGRYGSTYLFPNPPTEGIGQGQVIKAITSESHIDPRPPSNRPTAKGRGIYAFEVATLSGSVPTIATAPKKIWSYIPQSSDNTKSSYYLNFAIPSDLKLLDKNFDGLVDRVYVGDLGGRMWRFALDGTDADAWTGNIIYWDWYRKIFYPPSVAFAPDGTILVSFGTGDRAHPLNIPYWTESYKIYADKMVLLKDKGQTTFSYIDGYYSFDRNTYTGSSYSELVNVTLDTLQSDSASTSTIEDILANLNHENCHGWYIFLDRLNGSTLAGEKVLASSLIFNKVVYFTTYTPNLIGSSDPCQPGNLGKSRLYAVRYDTGEAVLNFANADNDSIYNTSYNNDTQSPTNNRAIGENGEVLRREDRSVILGVGIPSGIVVLVPPSGDADLLIGCGGGLCSQNPTGGGTIFPIYWRQW